MQLFLAENSTLNISDSDITTEFKSIFYINSNDVFYIPYSCDYTDIALYLNGHFSTTKSQLYSLAYDIINMPYLYDFGGNVVLFNNSDIMIRDVFSKNNHHDIRRSFNSYKQNFFPEFETNNIVPEYLQIVEQTVL